MQPMLLLINGLVSRWNYFLRVVNWETLSSGELLQPQSPAQLLQPQSAIQVQLIPGVTGQSPSPPWEASPRSSCNACEAKKTGGLRNLISMGIHVKNILLHIKSVLHYLIE